MARHLHLSLLSSLLLLSLNPLLLAASTPAGGLTVATQIQSGISGGSPNSRTETDVRWTDATNNGWQVGLIPGYGGANISPWYDISNGTTSGTQTSLATAGPDSLLHFTIDKAGTYLGTETEPYALSELAPVGTAFRRYYQAQVPVSGTDANGFAWTIRTAIYPGDPGFLIHRIDISNPSSASIPLGAADTLESDLIGGLQQQGESVWAPSNGGYGTVGGSSITGWPSTLTNMDPDYVYITPTGGSGIATGLVAVRKSSLSSVGGSNIQCQYLLKGTSMNKWMDCR